MVETWKLKKKFQPKRRDRLTGSLGLPMPQKKKPVKKIVIHISKPRCDVSES